MGKVLLASPRGYCAGVDRAVKAVEMALEHYGAPIYVRKEIVHNKHVVATLSKKGAVFVSELDQVPLGERVIFSAHGVSPQVEAEAQRRNLQVIDATCPLVTKVHREAQRFSRQDYDIVLIGHEGHEEVEGTLGQAPEHIQVVDTGSDVSRLKVRDEEKVVWISQTTLSVDETHATVEQLRSRFPALLSPPSQDICFATQNRQGAVKEIAARCDVLIVVGSSNSSNSVRLAEVGLQAGARAAYRVDGADELREDWFTHASVVGLTSGASVPEVLVAEVLSWLSGRGFSDVEQVQTVNEGTSFSLPKNLRAALRVE